MLTRNGKRLHDFIMDGRNDDNGDTTAEIITGIGNIKIYFL